MIPELSRNPGGQQHSCQDKTDGMGLSQGWGVPCCYGEELHLGLLSKARVAGNTGYLPAQPHGENLTGTGQGEVWFIGQEVAGLLSDYKVRAILEHFIALKSPLSCKDELHWEAPGGGQHSEKSPNTGDRWTWVHTWALYLVTLGKSLVS